MKSWKKALSLTIAVLMILGMLAGCGSSSGSSAPASQDSGAAQESAPAQSAEAPAAAAPAEDKMFNIVLTAAFTGFDPLRTNDSASTYINAQIYETLYRIDPKTGEYNCLLAAALPEFSDDGLTATVKLREGISFHNGEPFNSAAVMNTFALIKDPDFGSARASIANSIDTMECPDDYTIVFHLKYEDGVLTAKLAHTNSAIVPPEAQKTQDLMVQPVGTGPYKFVSSVSGSNVVLTANEDYWGGAPTIKNVTMTIVGEESTALARMETGAADFMPNVSVESIARIDGMPKVQFETSNAAQVYMMALRSASYINPIMEEEDFRKALCMSIDKEGYVEYIMEGYADAAESIMGPKITGFDEEATTHNIPYDPEGAKAILDAHPGWADEEILFLVPTSPAYAAMGEYFSSNLKNVGFNIKYEPIDWAAWLNESKVDNRFDITMMAWSNVTRDGSELFEPNFHSANGAKRIRYNEADAAVIDQFIMDSKTTSNMAVRTENLLGVNDYLQDHAFVQPLYHAVNMYCYNTAYTGCTRDAGGTFYLVDIGYAG